MKDKRKHHGAVDKRFSEQHFVNPTQLPLLRRNSRVVALVQAGLMAGWLVGWLIDEMQVNLNFLKFIIDQN